MQKVLLQLDTDRHPSAFDRVVALDAGVDQVLSYGGVQPAEVAGLVHGLLFTRSPADLRHSAVWVGGSDAGAAEALARAVQQACFGPFRVSLMMDANGCNTTAAAAVARLGSAGPLAGRRAAVLAGTGPVGLRAALLLAREGARVVLTSRSRDRAEEAARGLRARHGVEVEAAEVRDAAGLIRALDQVEVGLAAGAAGATLLPREVWGPHPTLRVLGDVNAVPPLGIEGIEATDKGTEREGTKVWGALSIGSLKMKVHKACVERLFTRNDDVLDVDAVYAVARAL